MNFLDLVRKARTCRRFDQRQPLSQADLNWLLECVRLAPSARNAQLLRYISATAGPVLNEVLGLANWAAALPDWPGPGEGERPTALLAVLTPLKAGTLIAYDVGISCQTIQLAAASRGWGSCMMGSFSRDQAGAILQVPPEMQIALLVWLGVEKEERVADDLAPGGSFHYWRDARGTHHVPKRSVAELLLASYH